jgi:hypothetical protein
MRSLRVIALCTVSLLASTCVTAQSSGMKPIGAAPTQHKRVLADEMNKAGSMFSEENSDLLFLTMIANPTRLAVKESDPIYVQIGQHAKILQTLNRVLNAGKRGVAQQAIAAAGPGLQFGGIHISPEPIPVLNEGTVEYMIEESNAEKAMFPYVVAMMHAQALVDQGYRLRDMSGNACLQDKCSGIDSMTAMFMMTSKIKGFSPDIASRLEAAKAKGNPAPKQDPSNATPHCSFRLPDIYVSGEIARLVRDPGRRTLDIVQGIRDGIISPSDNGDRAKIIRDPIKCTIGKLFGSC